MRKINNVKASCHPNEPHVARGLCRRCYQSKFQNPSKRCSKWNKTESGKNSNRRRRLLKMYGITPEDFAVMFAAQNGVCDICHQPETRQVGRRPDNLSVDHDHRTGKIRGLLCHKCNRLLCNSCDNSELLKKAAEYLDKQLPQVRLG